MDKKLTDNEIKKALECAIRNDCDCNCVFLLPNKVQDVLDLINRQDGEINRLQAENKRLSALAELGNKRANDYRVMRDRALKAEAENERLERHTKMHDEIKSEAYKEFAELLCEIWQRYEDENISGIYVPKWVMRVYEELVGDDKCS